MDSDELDEALGWALQVITLSTAEQAGPPPEDPPGVLLCDE